MKKIVTAVWLALSLVTATAYAQQDLSKAKTTVKETKERVTHQDLNKTFENSNIKSETPRGVGNTPAVNVSSGTARGAAPALNPPTHEPPPKRAEPPSPPTGPEKKEKSPKAGSEKAGGN